MAINDVKVKAVNAIGYTRLKVIAYTAGALTVLGVGGFLGYSIVDTGEKKDAVNDRVKHRLEQISNENYGLLETGIEAAVQRALQDKAQLQSARKGIAAKVYGHLKDDFQRVLASYNNEFSRAISEMDGMIDRKVQSQVQEKIAEMRGQPPEVRIYEKKSERVYFREDDPWRVVNEGESIAGILKDVSGRFDRQMIREVQRYNNLPDDVYKPEVGMRLYFPSSFGKLENVQTNQVVCLTRSYPRHMSLKEICKKEFGDESLVDDIIKFNKKSFDYNLKEMAPEGYSERIVYLPGRE